MESTAHGAAPHPRGQTDEQGGSTPSKAARSVFFLPLAACRCDGARGARPRAREHGLPSYYVLGRGTWPLPWLSLRSAGVAPWRAARCRTQHAAAGPDPEPRILCGEDFARSTNFLTYQLLQGSIISSTTFFAVFTACTSNLLYPSTSFIPSLHPI
jgi:hypothetical protein